MPERLRGGWTTILRGYLERSTIFKRSGSGTSLGNGTSLMKPWCTACLKPMSLTSMISAIKHWQPRLCTPCSTNGELRISLSSFPDGCGYEIGVWPNVVTIVISGKIVWNTVLVSSLKCRWFTAKSMGNLYVIIIYTSNNASTSCVSCNRRLTKCNDKIHRSENIQGTWNII